jgi:hypothetical protein
VCRGAPAASAARFGVERDPAGQAGALERRAHAPLRADDRHVGAATVQPAHGVDEQRDAGRVVHARIAQVDRDRLPTDAGLLEDLGQPPGAVEVDGPVDDDHAPRVGAGLRDRQARFGSDHRGPLLERALATVRR